jgi:hypothetical protein
MLHAEWFPHTSGGTRAITSINNLDIDEATDNKARLSHILPLGFIKSPRHWRQRWFIRLAHVWDEDMQDTCGVSFSELPTMSDAELMQLPRHPNILHVTQLMRYGRGWIDRRLVTSPNQPSNRLYYQRCGPDDLGTFDDFLDQHFDITLRHLHALMGHVQTNETSTCGKWYRGHTNKNRWIQPRLACITLFLCRLLILILTAHRQYAEGLQWVSPLWASVFLVCYESPWPIGFEGCVYPQSFTLWNR